MGLIASRRRSLRLLGNWDSSLLDLELSQLTCDSFWQNHKALYHHHYFCMHCVYVCANMFVWKNYIRTLQFQLPGAVCGLWAEDPPLELHQLAPQGVLLSQGVGNHGLGLISRQVRLQAWGWGALFIQHHTTGRLLSIALLFLC